MPYKRIWIPDLQAWKIVGELSGEEALALSATIPQGMTQWGWNASTGVFAYGNQYQSQLQTFETIPVNVRNYLIQFPKDVPIVPEGNTFEFVSGENVNVSNGDNDNSWLGAVALVIGSLALTKRSRRHGYKNKSHKTVLRKKAKSKA